MLSKLPGGLPMPDNQPIKCGYSFCARLGCVDCYPPGSEGKGSSDGGPSEYYDFPESSVTLNDLIEHKRMSFAQGNIFKAAYRLGNKRGISLEYDLKKIIYYAERLLRQINK